ncbi:hypothetical protein JW877_07525 [bacterium]|nr:hypothetical protein [bacterium]
MLKTITLIFLCFIILSVSEVVGQVGGDYLNENALHPVPQAMTLEEYRDANRRISVALLLSSIPVPGMVHFYAGEAKTGWYLAGASALGILSIISGAALMDDNETYKDTDYGTIDIDGIRYEKIPYSLEDTTIIYHLRMLEKETRIGAGQAALVGLGAILIGGEILFDWIHGISIIEKKRDTVRYKYGRQMSLSLKPEFDPENAELRASLIWEF